MTGRPRGLQENYDTAHFRVRQAKGSASDHACVDCEGPARDWSLNRDLPEKFSMDVEDYVARCRRCHVGFDCKARWYLDREIARRKAEQ